MKKSILLFYLLFCFITVSMTTVMGASNLQVTFTSNPIIVAPGTNSYIELNLKSIGTGDVTDIEIEASSWDPSIVQPKGNWKISVGNLYSGDSTTALYEFYVPSDAPPALYQVVFEISSSTGDVKQTALIKVEDSTVLDLVSVSPSSIDVGSVTTVMFNISNNGKTTVNNILFTWDDPSDYILPVGSDNRITIPSIGAKNYTEVSINIMASPSIVPGVYPLIITLEFYDRTGTLQTITSEVGLQIGGKTDFEIVLQQSTTGTTSFAIANTGANVASSVIITIPPQLNYQTTGASSVSLGNLDAGDYTLASFQISSANQNTTQLPNFNRTGNFPSNFDPSMTGQFRNRTFTGFGGNNLIVEISYTDLFGVRQTVQKEVAVTSISSSGGSVSDFSSRFNSGSGFNSRSTSTDSGDSGTIYIIIGVVGIVVIIAILKTGKSKKFLKLVKKGKNK